MTTGDPRAAAIRAVLDSGGAFANPIHAGLHVGGGLLALGATQSEIDAVLDAATPDDVET